MALMCRITYEKNMKEKEDKRKEAIEHLIKIGVLKPESRDE